MPFDGDNNNTGFITTIYGLIGHKALWEMRNWKWVSSPLTTVHGGTLRECVCISGCWLECTLSRNRSDLSWLMAAMRSHYTRHLCEPALLQAAWRADRLYTSQQSLTNTPRLWPMCTENIFGTERPRLHGISALRFFLMYNLASNIIICISCQDCNIRSNMETSCNYDLIRWLS